MDYEFQPQGFLYERFPAAVGMIILTSIGIFGDINIIMASFKNKSLRTPCHIFIAANALSDLLPQVGLYIPVVLTLSGVNYIELELCWYIEFIPYFGMNAAVIFTLITGVDRLYSVLMPMKYNSAQKSYYLGLMLIAPCLYAFMWVVLTWLAMRQQPHNSVVCGVTTLIASSLSQYNFIATIILSFIVLIVYTTTWIVAKKLGSKMIGQLLKPLTIIMIVVTLTYPMSYILLAIINVVVPPERVVTFRMSTFILVCLGYAANFFVLFNFSKDYKLAFRKQLSWLVKSWSNSIQTGPTAFEHSRHSRNIRNSRRSTDQKSHGSTVNLSRTHTQRTRSSIMTEY